MTQAELYFWKIYLAGVRGVEVSDKGLEDQFREVWKDFQEEGLRT